MTSDARHPAEGVRRAWRPALGWLGLAVVGEGAALRLISAGHGVRYQHYPPFAELLREHPFALSIVTCQMVAVAAGLRARWEPLRGWLGRNLRPWQLLVMGAVFAVPSATVSPQVGRYLAELAFAALVQTGNLGTVVLAVWAIPSGVRDAIGERFGGLLERDGAGVDRVALLASAWVTLVAALLCVFVYERHPHLQDEVAYVFHARYFAQGKLTLPAPPVPEAFDFYLLQVDGDRSYSAVTPGWPAVLALGTLLGAPWLVNPVLGGLDVLLAFVLVRELYDRVTARVVVLLLAVSPWFVFLAMSFMTHIATLGCALSGAVAVMRARASRGVASAVWAGGAGVALGIGVLIRPLDGVLAGGLVGLWALGLGGRRLRIASLAALVLASIAVGGVMLPYNRYITGHATVFPINVYDDQRFHKNANAYGFGPDRGMGWAIDPWPGHGPLDALVNGNLNTFMLNVELFGWSAGSLLLAALAPFLGRLARADLAMLGVMAAVFTVYFFYYFSGGPDFGARYWFLMLLPLVVLTARGLLALNAALRPDGSPGVAGGGSVGVAVLSLMALVTFFPWRATDKYAGYLGMRPGIRSLASDGRFEKDLVLVRGKAHPDYASAAVYNPLDLRGDGPVFAWDRNPDVRARVLAAYAGRRAWIVDGPSLTGRGFEIVRGPIPARDLAAEPREVAIHAGR